MSEAPSGEDGVAWTFVAAAGEHVASAVYDVEAGGRDRLRGECSCGWRTESYGPAVMVWPAIRLHVLGSGS